MPKARKGPVQIRFEILEYLCYQHEPQPRTHIWRRATTLSYDDFLKHLAYLVERELVTEEEDGGSRAQRKILLVWILIFRNA